jgi:small-conductance mechanosensitive channel
VIHLALPLFDLLDDWGIDAASVTIWLSRIAGLIAVWLVVWILVHYLSRWIRRFDEHVTTLDINPREMRTLDRLLDYIIILVGLIVSLAILGWTSLLYSALTAAGLFSVILGFAVKDVAANFVSGIFLLIDQPFAPGDYIEIDGYAGTVDTISLRMTTLITLDGPVIHIPNSVLAVQPTKNYTAARDRRINFSVPIANDADVSRALDIINQVLADEEGLLPDKLPSVLVDDVREYAVDVNITAYAPSDTWLELASKLKQHIVTTLQASNIELAVPVRKNVNLDLATN